MTEILISASYELLNSKFNNLSFHRYQKLKNHKEISFGTILKLLLFFLKIGKLTIQIADVIIRTQILWYFLISGNYPFQPAERFSSFYLSFSIGTGNLITIYNITTNIATNIKTNF